MYVVRKECAFDNENGVSVLKERLLFLLSGRDRFLVFVESKQSNRCIRREGMRCSYGVGVAMAGIDMPSEIRVQGLCSFRGVVHIENTENKVEKQWYQFNS